MNYNTQLPRLIISEYGRNVQRMIDYCIGIENREERNRCARAIIQVMGQLNPQLRDVSDYNHKLWDHLFIISRFQLDVDSPYPKPSAESFQSSPEKVYYPSGKIRYMHYGKLMENMLAKAASYEDGPEKEELIRQLGNQMKRSYLTFNKELVNDQIIADSMNELSGGTVTMQNVSVLANSHELMKKTQINQAGKQQQQHKHKNNKQNNNRNYKRSGKY